MNAKSKLREGRKMLVPFYQLQGVITLVKKIKLSSDQDCIEKHYQDKNGDKAIVIMRVIKGQ